MEPMNESEQMYERLCRVVFGEAGADEIAIVEEALAASAELREQKAELEATVALVQGVCGPGAAREDDVLPAAAMSELASAAAAETVGSGGNVIVDTPWYRTSAFRAAAAVTLVAGASWAAVTVGGGTSFVEPDASDETSLADVEEPSIGFGRFDDRTAKVRRFDLGGVDGLASEATVQPRSESLSVNAQEPAPTTQDGAIVDLPEEERLSDTGAALDGYMVALRKARGELGGASSENLHVLHSEVQPEATWYGVQPQDSSTTVMFDAVTKLEALGYGPVEGASGQAGGGAGGAGSFLTGNEAKVLHVTPGPVMTPPATPAPTVTIDPTAETRSMGGFNPASVPPGPNDTKLNYAYERSASDRKLAEAERRAPGTASGAASSSDDFFLGRGGAVPRTKIRTLDEFGGWHRPLEHVPPTCLPNERPRDMFFRFWGDHPFVVSRNDALSTFAADVDTASFALARKTLESGYLPQRAQIRTEEFVNFAKPDLPAPTESTFAVHGELAPSPFGGREDRWLLRVGVRAQEIAREERPALALTFVVDTSGSMKENNRLELVKHAMRLLVNQLDHRDSIAIVAFNNQARQVLLPTPATAIDAVETALFGLQPGGSTNAEGGLKLGYQTAEATIAPGTQTRVVFLSDGVANVGQTDQDRIAKDVEHQRERGIFLNTIGVGMGNHNDVFLEQLADKGDGASDYIGDAKDARRAIVDRFVGGFVTVAKDVKIQVEFDPKRVLRWRQLGYENRAVRDADFRNDAVDAGEIGAGHQVTCLYEVELATGDVAAAEALATVRLRWKPVSTGEAQPAQEAVETSTALAYDGIVAASFRAASEGFRRAALGAQLAECLRRSVHVRGDSVQRLGKELAQLLADAPNEDTATIAHMTKRAIDLGLRDVPGPRPEDIDAKHRKAYYEALIRDLGGADTVSASAEGDEEAAGDDATPDTYESRIRDILNRDSSRKPH